MRKLALGLALASTALPSAAFARDGSAYIGLDAGLMKASSFNLRYSGNATNVGSAVRLHHKLGYDIDAVAGYDFGMFRLEGELGYKHAKVSRESVAATAAALYFGQPGSFPADGRTSVTSVMLNGLVDFGLADAISASVGLGIGSARVKTRAGSAGAGVFNFSSEDSGLAWQALAEVRTAVSDSVDLGLKYRYFNASSIRFGPFCRITCGPLSPYSLSGKFRSNSLLASLIFNFGAAAAPLPPPPPPPAPVAPATITCPDGSVIPATSTCPAPPPPPPPPPPAPVERGERGQ